LRGASAGESQACKRVKCSKYRLAVFKPFSQ
jgi:hypothetical protein